MPAMPQRVGSATRRGAETARMVLTPRGHLKNLFLFFDDCTDHLEAAFINRSDSCRRWRNIRGDRHDTDLIRHETENRCQLRLRPCRDGLQPP